MCFDRATYERPIGRPRSAREATTRRARAGVLVHDSRARPGRPLHRRPGVPSFASVARSIVSLIYLFLRCCFGLGCVGQWLAIDDLGTKYGNDAFKLTTRQVSLRCLFFDLNFELYSSSFPSGVSVARCRQAQSQADDSKDQRWFVLPLSIAIYRFFFCHCSLFADRGRHVELPHLLSHSQSNRQR